MSITLNELKMRYDAALLRSIESSVYDGKTPLYEIRYNHNHDGKGRFCSGGRSVGLTTSRKNVRLDSNGVPFSYPTVKLSKKEYADVMGEIGRCWHSKYQGKELCHLEFTDKTYYFENRGIGDYNIYRVKKG